MRQPLASLAALLGLALIGGLAALVDQSQLGACAVYPVEAAHANLARDSAAWVGRSVLVRGVLVGCPHRVCPGHEPYAPPGLIDPDQPTTVRDPLPVALAGPDPVLAFERRVPVLGALVPAPQVPHWDVVATYRVRFDALPAGSCPAQPCYGAVVLDAASDTRGEG
jgi:hypothetical protein